MYSDEANPDVFTDIKVFNRITFNSYDVSSDGYLLSHQSRREWRQDPQKQNPAFHKSHKFSKELETKIFGHSLNYHKNVPLVHPDEWETIARYFQQQFRLLTIEKSAVENLSHTFHPALKHLEYFAKVPVDAIAKEEAYSWVKTAAPVDLHWQEKELLTFMGSEYLEFAKNHILKKI